MKRVVHSPWFWFWLPILCISGIVLAVRGVPPANEVRAEEAAVFHYRLF